jgi:hypothetical protein
LKYPNNFLFRGLGITMDAHSVSHRLDNAGMGGPCLPNAIQQLLKIDAYYAAKFANLVKYLDSIPEGDGTVLDNSVAIWVNEMSDGNAHNHNNSPIVMAGSAGGYFKQGWIINVEKPGDAAMSNGRSLDQCTEGKPQQADGVSQGTGTPSTIANMPVNKLYCNIMTAMGMKANAQGFPEKGGAASEVTHYGYSDNTVEFGGGKGAQPASIHNPGGFTELKAS